MRSLGVKLLKPEAPALVSEVTASAAKAVP